MEKVNIFILIDALGWTYIKNRPFLDGIAKTKRPVKSLLGYSSAILPSIVTGKYPEEHKHWSLFHYNPNSVLFGWIKYIRWLPKKCLNSRLGRKIIEVISQKKAGYTGYFETYVVPVELLPYFELCERKSIYEPGGFDNCQSIFDVWKARGIKYACFNYTTADAELFRIVGEKIKREDIPVYFLYSAGIDRALHKFCKEKNQVNEIIDSYEEKIKQVFKIAGNKYKEVNLYIFSDHGMTPTDSTIDLKKEIDKLNFKMPQDYLAMYDSTMARFWFFNEQTKSAVIELLKKNRQGRILNDEELKNWRAYFPDRRYGEIIFLMNPGCLISPSFMSNNVPQGMHGFNPAIDTADGILVSNKDVAFDIRDVSQFFEIMKKATDK
ncbi:MAG: alkaline phosphatase family protein [Candidatus Ratteibacteria bacterium]|nr:alkaline phosphatase family protein [Candidatus Ratteibacteria bacterium]